MEKIIKIGDKEIKFKATAGTLRRYRALFLRDLMSDMLHLSEKMKDSKKGEKDFTRFDLEIFENVAYVMAKQGGNVDGDIDAWLDEFDMFSIYDVLPELLELWNLETLSMIESKKNLQKVVGK